MKVDALFMVGKGQTEIRQVEVGLPKSHEVQVEIKACGVCAWDSYLFKGVSLTEDYPFRFGHEGVGIVQAIGDQVDSLAVGDTVMVASGGSLMTQLANVPASNAVKINTTVTDYTHWIGEPVACVVNSMTNCPIVPGDRVVMVGTGYMGLLNVQALQAQPYGQLTTFEIREDRMALAKKYGATESFLLGTPESDARIAQIKAEGGAEVVMECSGSESGFQFANELLRNSGVLNLFGWQRGYPTFNGTPWHLKGIRIFNTAPNINKHFTDVLKPTERLMRRGVFQTADLVTHTRPYQQSQELFELALSKEDGYIKGAVMF
jgi:threonine dehydrogenase-like Zn-dependent dehydrogenase